MRPPTRFRTLSFGFYPLGIGSTVLRVTLKSARPCAPVSFERYVTGRYGSGLQRDSFFSCPRDRRRICLFPSIKLPVMLL